MHKFRLLSVILGLVMILGFSCNIYADDAEMKSVKPIGERHAHEAVAITPETTNIQWTTESDGWYYVEGHVVVDHRITVGYDTHLVLCDDAVLEFTNTIDPGFEVWGAGSLTIYSESDSGVIYNADPDSILIRVGGKKAELILNGGCLKSAGNCISVNKGYIDLEGGSVICESGDSFAIYIESGNKSIMNGTAVSSSSYGIYVGDDFTMYGGSISGGQLGVDCVNFKFYGGEISNCDLGISCQKSLEIGPDAVFRNNVTDKNVDGTYVTDINYNTGSVFSDSTGLIVIGGVVIIAAVAAIVIIKKKKSA